MTVTIFLGNQSIKQLKIVFQKDDKRFTPQNVLNLIRMTKLGEAHLFDFVYSNFLEFLLSSFSQNSAHLRDFLYLVLLKLRLI